MAENKALENIAAKLAEAELAERLASPTLGEVLATPDLEYAVSYGDPAVVEAAEPRGMPKGVTKVDVDESGEGHIYLEPDGRLHVHLASGRVVTHK